MSSTGIRAEVPLEGGTSPQPQRGTWRDYAVPLGFLVPAAHGLVQQPEVVDGARDCLVRTLILGCRPPEREGPLVERLGARRSTHFAMHLRQVVQRDAKIWIAVRFEERNGKKVRIAVRSGELING